MMKHATITQSVLVKILADAGHNNNYIAGITSLSYSKVSEKYSRKMKTRNLFEG